MFKFELDQTVFYLVDNSVRSAKISSRVVVENSHDAWASTKEQKQSWQPFGPSEIRYATCHGILPQGKIFATKEELAASLIGV